MSEEDTVGKIMSMTVRTVDSGETLSKALRPMLEYDIGSVVVTQGGKPVGIVTERDVVDLVAASGPDALSKTVGSIASKPLITVQPNTEVWKAFTIMLENKIRRLLVLEGGDLVGIVTERDLFKWVVKVNFEPNIPENLKKLIVQNP